MALETSRRRGTSLGREVFPPVRTGRCSDAWGLPSAPKSQETLKGILCPLALPTGAACLCSRASLAPSVVVLAGEHLQSSADLLDDVEGVTRATPVGGKHRHRYFEVMLGAAIVAA